jgi:predicted membrane protein (TIGR00267 family)
MIKHLKRFWKKLNEYDKIAHIAEIGRRYFAMNSFDGILTILGILIGSFVASVKDPKIIITTGLAASIAMGVSGIWGTYLTEEAERKRKLKELGKATLTDLKETKIAKAERAASLIVSFIDGISPFLAAVLVIIPFFFTSLLGIDIAYLLSIILAFVLLMALGGFLGHVSKENVFLDGLKMVFAGIICVVLILLVQPYIT